MPLIGEDNIMWGSDYPHPDCSGRTRTARWRRTSPAFSPSVQQKIVYDNVARLYGLN